MSFYRLVRRNFGRLCSLLMVLGIWIVPSSGHAVPRVTPVLPDSAPAEALAMSMSVTPPPALARSIANLDGAQVCAPEVLPTQVQAFCTDPFRAICELPDPEIDEYERRITEFEQGAYETALVRAARQLGRNLDTATPADFLPNSFWDVGKIRNYSAYMAHLDRIANPAANGADSGLEATFGIKEEMLRATEGMPIPEGSREALETRIRASELHTLTSVIASDGERSGGSTVFATLWGEIRGQCGNDGFKYNAYSRTDSSQIALCPGLMLSARVAARGGERFAPLGQARVLMATSHEIGHQIDDQRFPELYSAYNACMASRFPAVRGTPVSADQHAQYHHEIIADQYAIETFASYVSRSGFDRERGLTLMRSAWKPFCESNGDDHHPSGRYRIDMLRRSPAIHQYMGCPGHGMSGTPTCTLTGEESLR